MVYHIAVLFGKGREYDFQFTDADLSGQTAEQARNWFNNEFNSLECEPSNPVGKVLIIDKILNVAQYGSEARFADKKEWAKQFAVNAALALGRDTVRIDVAAFTIGY